MLLIESKKRISVSVTGFRIVSVVSGTPGIEYELISGMGFQDFSFQDDLIVFRDQAVFV